VKPTLTEIENLLLARLKDKLPAGVAIEAWPEKGLKHWIESGGAKRATTVLVHYAGSEFHEPETPIHSRIVQARIVTYRVFVVARSLRDPSAAARGAYALLDDTRYWLTGFDIGGPGRLRPAGEEVVELSDTLAIFAADFEGELLWIEPSEETGPAFTQGNTIDAVGGQSV
jgi:hypothetical protein